MIIYLCIKFQSNTTMLSKDIARKPKVLCMGRTGQTYVRTAVILYAPHPPNWKWRGHKNNIRFGYSLEAPLWGASHEYPQHMFFCCFFFFTFCCFFFCLFVCFLNWEISSFGLQTMAMARSIYLPETSDNAPTDICALRRFRSASAFIVWSESILGPFWIAKDAKFLQRRDWSDYMESQADLSLHWSMYQKASRKHTYIILTPLNPTFI